MKDRFALGDTAPDEGGVGSNEALTERQRLAESIERDFRTLHESLGMYKPMAGSAAALHIERVRESIERGIGLSKRLRNALDFGL